jgi:hypothetical protein
VCDDPECAAGTCKKLGEEGDVCDADTVCRLGTACSAGTCRPSDALTEQAFCDARDG